MLVNWSDELQRYRRQLLPPEALLATRRDEFRWWRRRRQLNESHAERGEIFQSSRQVQMRTRKMTKQSITHNQSRSLSSSKSQRESRFIVATLVVTLVVAFTTVSISAANQSAPASPMGSIHRRAAAQLEDLMEPSGKF